MVDDAVSHAFRRHYAEVFRFLRRRTRSAEEAEELAQAVFADAAVRLEDVVAARGSALAWLYAVARRRLVDQSRKDAVRAATMAELEASRAVLVEDVEYGPQLAHALRDSLRRLPDGQREVVVMKLFEGRSFAEIAARVDATEAACKMRFARALEALQDDLSRQGVEP